MKIGCTDLVAGVPKNTGKRSSEKVMKFTLVTTCLNEMRSLPRWREDLERQTRQPDEIVIIDAQSTDGTTEALRHWAEQDQRVKLRVEKCNAARGRNLAIAMATHEHIVSTDMGVRLDPRWFEEIVRPFETDSTRGDCGRVLRSRFGLGKIARGPG